MAKPGKKNPNPPDDDEPDPLEETAIPEGESATRDGEYQFDQAQAWLEENRCENENSTFTILRQKKAPSTGIERVFEFENTIIKAHEIGLRYGGGSYTVVLNLPTKKTVRRRYRRSFVLSAEYDKAKAAIDRENAPAGLPVVSGAPPQKSELEMLRGLVDVLTPIVKPVIETFKEYIAAKKKDTGDPSMRELIGTYQSALVEVGKQAAQSQITLFRDFSKELRTMQESDPIAGLKDAPAEAGEFAAFMKDVIREHGKDFVEAAGIRLKEYAKRLKESEIFQTLAQNEALTKRVYDLIMGDPELGKLPNFTPDLVNAFIKKVTSLNMGIKIPASYQTVNGAAPAASTAAAPTKG